VEENKVLKQLLPPAVFGLVLLLLWSLGLQLLAIHPLLIPGPQDVASALVDDRAAIAVAAWVTIRGAALGFAMAVICGFTLGCALVMCRWLRLAAYPYVLLRQMMPVLAVAAIIVIIFDVGLQSVALIAFFIGCFPVLAATLQGLQSVPKAERELLQLYKASRWQELYLLRIPHALPYTFTGAKIAATLAVIGSVTGEIFAGSSTGSGGLGFLIITFKSELNVAGIYAVTLVCCAIGFVFVGAVLLLRKRLLGSWHPSISQDWI
jgi:NitT/TauT family transport system permease protein